MPNGTAIKLFSALNVLMANSVWGIHPPEPPHQQVVRREESSAIAPLSADWREFLTDCGIELDRAGWEADNIAFYEALGDQEFADRTSTCGMDTNPDLMTARLRRLLGVGSTNAEMTPGVLVEVGGGMGRVIKFAAEHTKIPAIISVERSRRYAARLRRLIKPYNDAVGYERVRVFPTNLMRLKNLEKREGIADVITWLWWGFAEIHPSEKPAAMKLLYHMLKPGGTAVIDLPISKPVPTAVTEYYSNVINFRMSDEPSAPTLHLHRFTLPMLRMLAVDAGLIDTGCEEYVASSVPQSTKRVLCYFQRSVVSVP